MSHHQTLTIDYLWICWKLTSASSFLHSSFLSSCSSNDKFINDWDMGNSPISAASEGEVGSSWNLVLPVTVNNNKDFSLIQLLFMMMNYWLWLTRVIHFLHWCISKANGMTKSKLKCEMQLYDVVLWITAVTIRERALRKRSKSR